MRYCIVFLLWLSCGFGAGNCVTYGKCHAISYEGGSRFGDRVLGYAQARYLSFATGLPFLHRPFVYSRQLTIDFDASPFNLSAPRYRHTFTIYSIGSFTEFLCKILDPNTPPTLFIVDYFPSDISEWALPIDRSICLEIPWHEEQFHSTLSQSIAPRIPFPHLRKEGCLNVADHVRTLSGADSIDTSIIRLPLKCANLDYHRRQIRRIYEWNLKRPMRVFLISDTKKPLELIESFRRHFAETNIEFDIQILKRPDTDHAVQDFFAMQEFDALIATQSNFSMMAWRVGALKFVIHPEHSTGKYPDVEIDRIHVVSQKPDWFPYELDLILQEDLSDSSKEWFPEAQ